MNDKKNTATEAVEDFIKTVYVLQQALPDHEDRVATNALREALNISAPSVTEMAQRLVVDELVDYERYRGVRLTKRGVTLALSVLRRHRLIELYLVQELGYPLHAVHEEAEKIEHAVSDYFVEAIAKKLGHPTVDPHGDPIPSEDGVMASPHVRPLAELPTNSLARVSRFIAQDPALLQYALDKGFKLNGVVCVIAREPFRGSLTVTIANLPVMISYPVAESILVEEFA